MRIGKPCTECGEVDCHERLHETALPSRDREQLRLLIASLLELLMAETSLG